METVKINLPVKAEDIKEVVDALHKEDSSYTSLIECEDRGVIIKFEGDNPELRDAIMFKTGALFGMKRKEIQYARHAKIRQS